MEILLTYKNLACIIFTDLIQLHLRTSKIKFIIIITPRKQTQITSKGGEIMEKVENIILLEIKNLQKDVSNLDKKIDKKLEEKLSQMKKEILQEMDIRLKEIEEKFDKKLEERISQNTKEISQEITEVIKYICERYDNKIDKIEDKVKKENKQNKALHNEYNSRMYKIELSQANIEEKVYDLEHEEKKIS